MEKIKVLIVDDSEFIKTFLTEILENVKDIEISDYATDGDEAIEKLKSKEIDVILMDIEMPNKNGVLATKEIMAKIPRPIIVFSTYGEDEVKDKFKLFDYGALEYIKKVNFFNLSKDEKERFKGKLIEKIKLASRINVIPHIHQWKEGEAIFPILNRRIKIIGIGASTGGPKTIKKIISNLEKDFNIPILIVQHITSGFLEDFVNSLTPITTKNVKIAVNGEKIVDNVIYFMPNGYQPVLENGNIFLDRFARDVGGFKPSVNVLFSEIAKDYRDESVGIILTGMGSDGAEGLLKIKRAGGITIAQDEKSCAIFGMPQKAIEINAAQFVFNIEKIINFLNNIYRK